MIFKAKKKKPKKNPQKTNPTQVIKNSVLPITVRKKNRKFDY